MNLEELRNIRDAILEHPDMEVFARNLGHVISYLMSEQEKRIQLNAAIDKLTEKLTAKEGELMKQGFILLEMQDRSKRNGKLLITVLGTVLSLGALELVKLAFK